MPNGSRLRGGGDVVLYFAYGPEMSPEVMRSLLPGARALGAARLDGYRVGYYDESPFWGGGEVAVVHDDGAAVWGVLYALSCGEFERLDRWADSRDDGAGARFRFPVTVVDLQGWAHAAYLYKKDLVRQERPPGAVLRDHMLAGALAHRLPPAYVAHLRGLAVRPSTSLPVLPRAPAACGDCGSCAAADGEGAPGAERS